MRQIVGTIGLAVVVVWGGLAGCHKPAVREKPLPDPLLTSKKPVEGKPHTEDPEAARPHLPPPPPMPPSLDKGFASMAQDVPLVQLLGPRATR
jgi:hypothetical protein